MSFSDFKLNPMYPAHIPPVLKIIAEHDEDDAEYAEESYDGGLENQYVLQKGSTVIGVTGFNCSDDIAMISWTYLASEYTGKGYGSEMMRQLFTIMEAQDLRKAYVQASDYREEKDSPMLYANAIKLYKKLAFEQEAYHPDYYDEGEGMLVYGKRLAPPRYVSSTKPRENARGIELENIFLIDETETCYAIDWAEKGSKPLTAKLLSATVKFATTKGASSVYISFPSTFSSALTTILSEANFHEEGQLADYHADGIHEVRYKFTPHS